ncbi:MAG: hypothetical protein WCM76_08080 [Bacteroidota bacterium]
MSEFDEWFNQNKDKAVNKIEEYYTLLKEKYGQLTDKAAKAKFEDHLASDFNEDIFVKALLEKDIEMTFAGKKSVRSFLDNYEKSEWVSGFECFRFVIHHTNQGDLMEFKINFSRYTTVNLFRLNNVIRHDIDKNDAEGNMKIKPGLT